MKKVSTEEFESLESKTALFLLPISGFEYTAGVVSWKEALSVFNQKYKLGISRSELKERMIKNDIEAVEEIVEEVLSEKRIRGRVSSKVIEEITSEVLERYREELLEGYPAGYEFTVNLEVGVLELATFEAIGNPTLYLEFLIPIDFLPVKKENFIGFEMKIGEEEYGKSVYIDVFELLKQMYQDKLFGSRVALNVGAIELSEKYELISDTFRDFVDSEIDRILEAIAKELSFKY